MRKKLYFDSQYGVETFALCEDGKLTDYRSEPVATGAVVGNIYKGRVTDVLNGMQAAFVDCGLERHCYLSASDAVVICDGEDGTDGGKTDAPQPLNLHEGEEILVQVIKPAQGKKGARVTARPTFVGKYAVFMPNTPFIGVSAKIADEELRKNLSFSAGKLVNDGEGLVVRTAAPYATLRDKKAEIEHFRSVYKNILVRFDDAPVGELFYSDSPLYMRVLRDLMLDAGDEIYAGNEELFRGIKALSETADEHSRARVIFHDPHTDLFYREGIYGQLVDALQPKAELENGAYIVIDRTEALTVIDVNTGKFTGEDSLEHTVYCTNVLAAREIARQVKLRNLGGIFVVDFIDMAEEKHKKAIVEELEKALKADGARCKVLPMSKFGLVEFTRKRSGVSITDGMLATCQCCNGTGATRTDDNVLAEFRARLLDVLSEGCHTVCVDLNIGVAGALLSHTALKSNIASLYPEARVYIIAHRTYRQTDMYFRKVDANNYALPEGNVLLY